MVVLASKVSVLGWRTTARKYFWQRSAKTEMPLGPERQCTLN